MVQLYILSPEELRKRLDEFMANGGEEKLRAATQKAKAAQQQIREALRVDRDTLDKPMTI